MTTNFASCAVPKAVEIATSAASRPRAITIRPMRGWLLARIERKPAAVQIDLEPRAEIHRRGIDGNADIAEIPRAISRRNVHASTQRNGKMCEIPADANAFVMPFRRCAVAARVMIAEADPRVSVVADCLHPLPARRHIAELGPG